MTMFKKDDSCHIKRIGFFLQAKVDLSLDICPLRKGLLKHVPDPRFIIS